MLVGWLALVVYLGTSIKERREVDVNSGLERRMRYLGPFTTSQSIEPTSLSELVLGCGLAGAAPDWKTYHTRYGWMGPRVNWRYGGIVSGIRGVLQCMELVDEHGVHDAKCAAAALCLDLLKRQDRSFNAFLDDDDRGFVVVDDQHNILLRYRPDGRE